MPTNEKYLAVHILEVHFLILGSLNTYIFDRDMQNVADVAGTFEAHSGSEKWEGSSFKESSCCFDQDLRELHSIFL